MKREADHGRADRHHQACSGAEHRRLRAADATRTQAPPHLVDVTGVDPVDELHEGAVRFGQALTEAVQHRVRAADGVVGADLSGGLDYSTAVVLAADAGTVHAVTYPAPVLVQLRPGGA
ncbi:asparagine synthase-related protein [Streptomyces sp. NBC_01362]|uniref:asparagine synthase-related protein n=1 Tax=Streptomyces sp. NBC_01362 TaxID=2903839 RepID=UPI002E2F9B7B|nr:asparagine synthase-related protein [Streptomyces sp. NBC_01362]